MEEILLSIGSVCTLKGRSEKIMITGYLSVEYKNQVEIKDYLGCVYPYGVNHNKNISFNADEIETVLFEGYSDDDFNNVFKLVSDYKVNLNKIDNSQVKLPFAFDENGVVVADYEAEKTENVDTVLNNPFQKNNADLVRNDVPEDSSKWSIFNHIEFDENGVVVAALETDPNTPDENLEEPTVIIRKKDDRFKFDENGVVVEDNSVATEENVNVNSPFKFDENGVVVEDNSVATEENVNVNSPFKFDENGVVVEDNSVATEENVNVNSPFKFDENGVVVEDKSV